MDPIKSKFSVQIHWQKKNRSEHFDLRILDPKKKFLWSWAMPKKRFPDYKEKVLALKTANHKISYMYFSGTLTNGDKVGLYDRGECTIIFYNQKFMIVKLDGVKVNGIYNFIKLINTDNSWLIMASKKM